MEPTTPLQEETLRAAAGETDIEAAAAGITAEIARRCDTLEHPLNRYQVVCSADQRCIWIASAVGACMDSRFTPLEVHAEQSWTWHCENPEDDDCDVGWRISTPADIVDLLVDALGHP